MPIQIKIVDLNRSLIQACKEAGLNAEWADYFSDIQPNEILITASNPMWSFGGGIDLSFYNHYYKECRQKQEKGGGMERIGNIVFAITVDETYKATTEIIEKAIRFALSTLKENEVLRLSGIGTGIGGLTPAQFVATIKRIAPKSPSKILI